MQIHDRAVLAGSKLLVGSRFARAFTAIYALLLHAFVMLLLYHAMSPRTQIEMVGREGRGVGGRGTEGAKGLQGAQTGMVRGAEGMRGEACQGTGVGWA